VGFACLTFRRHTSEKVFMSRVRWR
jgi:hypothetical protein